ncbi:hypothetical protein WA171_001761, partial [Blastocystis sp. BT1]
MRFFFVILVLQLSLGIFTDDIQKSLSPFKYDSTTDGSQSTPKKNHILEVYYDALEAIDDLAIRRELSHIRQNAVLIGLPSPDMMTIAKELAWEESNGEENQIEFLDMKDLHVMSYEDKEIQYLLNRFIVKNMVGKSSLIVSSVECSSYDNCDFKYFSKLLMQDSVVTFFDTSFEVVTRAIDFQIIFILPTTDRDQIKRLQKLSNGSLFKRAKSRDKLLIDLMSFGGVSYVQHTRLVPFVPIMKQSIDSIMHILLSKPFLESFHVKATMNISDDVITTLTDEKYSLVHYDMIPLTSIEYLTYGTDELVFLLQRLVTVTKLHCPKDYNTTKTISLNLDNNHILLIVSSRGHSSRRGSVSVSNFVEEMMAGVLG